MTVGYRYIGIFLDTDPRNAPSGIVPVWTDAEGEQKEETSGASLTWKPSEVFDPMARPDELRYIGADELIVEGFFEQMRQRCVGVTG